MCACTHTHVGATCPIRKMNSSHFPSCINHEFPFFIFWCFDIWRLADVGRIVPSRNCQFLEVVNNLAMNMTFKCEPVNPEPYPQPPGLLGSPSHHYLPALIIPGPGSRELIPQSSLKSFKLANPKSDHPCMFLFMEPQIENFCPVSLFPLTANQPRCFPKWPWHAPFCEYNKLLSSVTVTS